MEEMPQAIHLERAKLLDFFKEVACGRKGGKSVPSVVDAKDLYIQKSQEKHLSRLRCQSLSELELL